MPTITKTEIRWIISALNTHIETCNEFMQDENIADFHREILQCQSEGYAGLVRKLEGVLLSKAKRIAIK